MQAEKETSPCSRSAAGAQFVCFSVFTAFTFGIKVDGVTVGLPEAPGTVEDGSSLCNVGLRRVGLGGADHHAGAADKAEGDTGWESTAARQPKQRTAIHLDASNASPPGAAGS